MNKKLLTALLLFAAITSFGQQRYYVAAGAAGNNTGSSWSDAFNNLHNALALAVWGDEIWVQEGLYRPSAGGDRSARFELSSGVKLLGGFSGTENTPEERGNPEDHATILSGDIGVPGDSLDNSYNLMYCLQPDSTTLIDGFVFRDALANKTGISSIDVGGSGGGLYIQANNQYAYPTISNCRFEHNSARNNGAGLFLNGFGDASVSPKIINCQFEDNRCLQNGGAVYWKGGSAVERPDNFNGCRFVNNTAYQGGAIYWWDGNGLDTMNVKNSYFENNHAAYHGLALMIAEPRVPESNLAVTNTDFSKHENKSILTSHPALFNGAMNVSLQRVGFEDNFLQIGSGYPIYLELFDGLTLNVDSIAFVNNRFKDIFWYSGVDRPSVFSNLLYKNNTGFLNLFSLFGNSQVKLINLYIEKNSGGSANIFADTIVNLVANNNKGLRLSAECIINSLIKDNVTNIYGIEGETNIYNSIIYNNFFYYDYLNGDTSFYPLVPTFNKSQNFYNCIFKDSVYNNMSFVVFDLNFDNCLFHTDPLFVSPSTGDLHLQPCSPGVHFGIDSIVAGLQIAQDLDGRSRIQGGRVDLGPYETPAAAPAELPAITGACDGGSNGSINFVTDGGCPPYTYLWSTGETNGPNFQNLTPGIYTVTISDSKGSSNVLTLEVPAASLMNITALTTPVFCGTTTGGTVAFEVENGAPPFVYDWGNGPQSDSLSTGLAYGVYAVTITDNNGCTQTGSAQVGRMGNLEVHISKTPLSCHDSMNGSIIVGALNGAPPFNWIWDNGSIDSSLNLIGPGIYAGSMTDALGCGINWLVPVLAPDSISVIPTVTAASGPLVADGSILLTISGGTGAFEVKWQDGQTGLAIDSLLPGIYPALITDENGCMQQVSIAVNWSTATNEAFDQTLSVWPSPATDRIFVAAPAGGLNNFSLLDNHGRVVRSLDDDLEGVFRVDLTDLPAGMYFWKAAGSKGRYYQGIIVCLAKS